MMLERALGASRGKLPRPRDKRLSRGSRYRCFWDSFAVGPNPARPRDVDEEHQPSFGKKQKTEVAADRVGDPTWRPCFMNSSRNLPILLSYLDDGSVLAHCPMLENFRCKFRSRKEAISNMQQITRLMMAQQPAPAKQTYEVVHLAVSPAADAPGRVRKRAGAWPKMERPLLELV